MRLILSLFVVVILYAGCKKEEPNTPPVASFTISPESGDTDTEFTFDASGCIDKEDASDDLKVRWDFETDGVFDTEYSKNKVSSYQYTEEGSYHITLEVKDSEGLSNSLSEGLNISLTNQPPELPTAPSPTNNSVDQSLSLTLSWTCTDPDGDPLEYDIYFGIESPPPLIENGWTELKIEVNNLTPEVTYYWKIVVTDNEDQSEGPIWSFTTIENLAPNVITLTHPSNQIISEPGQIEISWTGSDPENDPLRYDIYFGNSIPPLLYKSDHPLTMLNIDMEAVNWYFLRIDTKDFAGNLTQGGGHSFIVPPQKKLKKLTCYQADTMLWVNSYHYNSEGLLTDFVREEWMSMAYNEPIIYTWKMKKQFTWKDKRIETEERQWKHLQHSNSMIILKQASLIYNYDTHGFLQGISAADNPEENLFTMGYDDMQRIILMQEGFRERDKETPPLFKYEYNSENEIKIRKEVEDSFDLLAQEYNIVLDDNPNPQWVEQYPVYVISNVKSNQINYINVSWHNNIYRTYYYEYEYEYDSDSYPLVKQQILPDRDLRWVYEY